MSSLEDSIELSAMDAAQQLTLVHDPATPVQALGGECLELGEKLRAIGIAALLARGEPDTLLHNLIRSATAWVIFLERCRKEQQTDDHHYCAGRYDPLIDAIAARRPDLAGRIIQAGPAAYRPPHEYLADHAYARMLGLLLDGRSDIDEQADRCADEGTDIDGARADVCRAIARADQDAFDESFAALITERKKEIRKSIDGGQPDDFTIEMQRRVFIEGIALLNLAELRQLTSSPTGYDMCPTIALLPLAKPFRGM